MMSILYCLRICDSLNIILKSIPGILFNEKTESSPETLGVLTPDPDEMIQATIDHIDKKRAALGLQEYDPSRWGRSGDTRMLELEEMSLEERRVAMYGAAD